MLPPPTPRHWNFTSLAVVPFFSCYLPLVPRITVNLAPQQKTQAATNSYSCCIFSIHPFNSHHCHLVFLLLYLNRRLIKNSNFDLILLFFLALTHPVCCCMSNFSNSALPRPLYFPQKENVQQPSFHQWDNSQTMYYSGLFKFHPYSLSQTSFPLYLCRHPPLQTHKSNPPLPKRVLGHSQTFLLSILSAQHIFLLSLSRYIRHTFFGWPAEFLFLVHGAFFNYSEPLGLALLEHIFYFILKHLFVEKFLPSYFAKVSISFQASKKHSKGLVITLSSRQNKVYFFFLFFYSLLSPWFPVLIPAQSRF